MTIFAQRFNTVFAVQNLRGLRRLSSLLVTHLATRPVTSLGHQGWRRVFWEGPKFF